MATYEVMIFANSFLLLLVTALAGALWASLRAEQREHKENFRLIWQDIAINNKAISETLRQAEKNQVNIENNQRIIKSIQHDIREQNTRINELDK